MGQDHSHVPPPPDRAYKAVRRRELLVKRIAQKMINSYGTPYPDRQILAQETALSKPGDIEFYYDFIQRVYNPQTGEFREDLNRRLHYDGDNQHPVGQPQMAPQYGGYHNGPVGQPQVNPQMPYYPPQNQQPQYGYQPQQAQPPQTYAPGPGYGQQLPPNAQFNPNYGVAPTPFDI